MPSAIRANLGGMAMLLKAKAILRLTGFLLVMLVFFLPLQFALLLHIKPLRDIILQQFYRLAGKCWGVRIVQHGTVTNARPLLVVSNHSSYLDIPVLGQAAPVRFTPKSEIRSWPLIGWLSVLAGCVFIERRRDKTTQARKELEVVLGRGEVISLFPEGSTNDGSELLPFHSSFFSLAEMTTNGQPLQVQPVGIIYTKKDGTAFNRAEMDKVAWYAEMEFVPHLWEYLQTDGVLATMTFHTPLTLAESGGDRKALTKQCETIIATATKLEVKKGRLVAEAPSNNGG